VPGYAVHEPHYEHRRKRKNHVGLLWTARRESRKIFGLVLAIVRETVVGSHTGISCRKQYGGHD